jgi:hypothetical protein
MTAHSTHGVIPAKAGTHEQIGSPVFTSLCSWVPASVGMTLNGEASA